MPVDPKKLIKNIVRRVHPDLFGSRPAERTVNSESLKVLNSYVDDLSRGNDVTTSQVEFFVEEDKQLIHIVAELPSYGSLGPLFYAFGLITAEQLSKGVGAYHGDEAMDTDFLEWLGKTVGEALTTAEQHESLKSQVRELRTAVENRFDLIAVHVGGEYAVTTLEQKRQLESLNTLNSSLINLLRHHTIDLSGLSLRLYHPEVAPSQSRMTTDENGEVSVVAEPLKSYVAEDGVFHMVAEHVNIQNALLQGEDLEKARVLSKASWIWTERIKQLQPRLRDLLRVPEVWCDTANAETAAEFVAWAGRILSHDVEFRQALRSRWFSFNILVHCDATAPALDFMAASSVLQMRADCPPGDLLIYLQSESVDADNNRAEEYQSLCAMEEDLLRQVKVALGAKHVIRVCSSKDQDKVIRAAQRLLDNASVIRAAVDLSGISIAIDDCYELWESGFISIPFHFKLQELQPELQRLLGVSSYGQQYEPWEAPVSFTYDSGNYIGLSDGLELPPHDWSSPTAGLGARASAKRLTTFHAAPRPYTVILPHRQSLCKMGLMPFRIRSPSMWKAIPTP
eukprot:jgi/Botrbrau1/11723/Bobra.0195s0050.1